MAIIRKYSKINDSKSMDLRIKKLNRHFTKAKIDTKFILAFIPTTLAIGKVEKNELQTWFTEIKKLQSIAFYGSELSFYVIVKTCVQITQTTNKLSPFKLNLLLVVLKFYKKQNKFKPWHFDWNLEVSTKFIVDLTKQLYVLDVPFFDFFSRTNYFEPKWILKEKYISASDFEFYKKVLAAHYKTTLDLDGSDTSYLQAFQNFCLVFIKTKQMNLAFEAYSYLYYTSENQIKENVDLAFAKAYLTLKEQDKAENFILCVKNNFYVQAGFVHLLHKHRQIDKSLAFLDVQYSLAMNANKENKNKVQLLYCLTLLQMNQTSKAIEILTSIPKDTFYSDLRSKILDELLKKLEIK
jgi:hypothetical protein